MQQAEDFRAESRALAAVMEPLSDADFDMPTLFKGWTIDDVVGHLHHINAAAEATLEGRFESFFAPATDVLARGGSLREAQYVWLAGLRGRALCDAWATGAERVADLYAAADPKMRVKWAGPDMSALSAITARQMET